MTGTTPHNQYPFSQRGDRVQQTLQEFHAGTEQPSEAYERWCHKYPSKMSMDELASLDLTLLEPSELRELQLALNNDRIANIHYTSAVRAHLQLKALETAADVAVENLPWDDIESLAGQQRLDDFTQPNYPQCAQDFITTYGKLDLLATTQAANDLRANDPEAFEAYVDARYMARRSHGAILDITDVLAEKNPTLKAKIEAIESAFRAGALSHEQRAIQLANVTGTWHRVTVFDPRGQLDKDAIRQEEDTFFQADAKLDAARVLYNQVAGWAAVLTKNGTPAEALPKDILDYYVATIADAATLTMPRLHFHGINPQQEIDSAIKQATISSSGRLVLPPVKADGPKKGGCVIRHHVEVADGSPLIATASKLETYARERHGATGFSLIHDGAIRIADLYVTIGVLLAAQPGGWLDPAAGVFNDITRVYR